MFCAVFSSQTTRSWSSLQDRVRPSSLSSSLGLGRAQDAIPLILTLMSAIPTSEKFGNSVFYPHAVCPLSPLAPSVPTPIFSLPYNSHYSQYFYSHKAVFPLNFSGWDIKNKIKSNPLPRFAFPLPFPGNPGSAPAFPSSQTAAVVPLLIPELLERSIPSSPGVNSSAKQQWIFSPCCQRVFQIRIIPIFFPQIPGNVTGMEQQLQPWGFCGAGNVAGVKKLVKFKKI